MNEKHPCRTCGNLILSTTAARTGGLCMPCKGGYRENIENGKRYAQDRAIDAGGYSRLKARGNVGRPDEGAGGIVDAVSDGRVDPARAVQEFGYACAEARWNEARRARPDLDQIPALAMERDQQWARVGAADFLTAAEKRVLLGLPRLAEGE